MNAAEDLSDEVQTLLDQLALDELTIEQAARLEELACDDSAIRERYIHWVSALSVLRLQARLWNDVGAVTDVCSPEPEPQPASVPQTQPVTPALSGVFQDAVGFFGSGWPVAYLIATVVFGLGLIIGSMVRAPQPTELAVNSHFSSTLPYTISSLPCVVGRVTGMADCVWEGSGFRVQGSENDNQKSAVALRSDLPSPAGTDLKGWSGRGAGGAGDLRLHSPIHLNDRLALRSGLLEITYDTGARVILQGPVTYKVRFRRRRLFVGWKAYCAIRKESGSSESPLARLRRGAGGEGGSQRDTDGDHNQPQSALTLASPTSGRGDRTLPSPLSTLHSSLFPLPRPS